VRGSFLRRLPRPVRWLWFAILAVLGLECAALALGFVLGGAWLWTALQLSYVLAGPLALGLLVIAGVSAWTGYRRSPPGGGRPDDGQPPQMAQPGSPEPVEVVAGRRAGEAVTALARSRGGKVAIAQTARLVRAVRAAAQPAPGTEPPDGGDDRRTR
jgi:hypothetical protein